MKAVPGYGKILALGSTYTENALIGEVVVQEKVDGSQFGFGVNEDGELVCRSKSTPQQLDGPDKMFTKATEYLKSISDKITSFPRDTYFYCEYLSSKKHNTLSYENVPKNNLVLFDCVLGGKYVTREALVSYAETLEIDVIPELYRGEADVEKVKSLLKTESYLVGEGIEGVVVKNYTQTILLGGQIFPLFTKFVNEEFKERHGLDWATRTPKGGLQAYIQGFATPARWLKAIYWLRDKNELTNSPKDIGPILKRIQFDVVDEEKENIKNELYKIFHDDILRASIRGFPQYYKLKLLENLNDQIREGVEPEREEAEVRPDSVTSDVEASPEVHAGS